MDIAYLTYFVEKLFNNCILTELLWEMLNHYMVISFAKIA